MISVIGYAVRQTKDGREFNALILQGGLHIAQSQKTGNQYATIKKCSIPSTFDEETAKGMIGEKLPGSIEKKSCDPYEFVNKETGEVIELNYRWAFVPEGATIEEAVFEGAPEVAMVKRRDPLRIKPIV